MATKKNQYRAQPLEAIDFEAAMARADSMLPQPADQKLEGAGLMRTVGDMAIKGAQGVVDLGASAVGLGNIVTGGLAGKGMDALGYDPQRTNATMGEYLSSAQKESDAKVQNAQGFVDTVGQAVTEPRFLAGSLMQSLPGILAMGGMQGAVARSIAGKAALSTTEGALAATGKAGDEAIKAALSTTKGAEAAKAAIAANETRLIAIGAGSEGGQTAGGIAQEAQHAGRSWDQYAPAALGAGVMTAAIGAGAGKLMGDAGTKIFTGTGGQSGTMLKQALKSGFSEGALEEMPQSASEQMFTNVAMGEQDVMKGVANAAGTGLVTGAAMGVGMGALGGSNSNAPDAPPVQDQPKAPTLQSGNTPDPLISFSDGTVARRSEVEKYISSLPPDKQPAARAKLMGLAPQPASPADQLRATKVPENGTMSAAVNAGIEGQAQDIESGKQAVIDLNSANEADQAAYEQSMAQEQEQAAVQAQEQDSVDKPVTSGKIAEAQMSEEDKRAVLFSNQPVIDGGQKFEGTQDGDVLNGLGAPFKTKMAALRRATMEGKDWTIAPVFDGWVARRKDSIEQNPAQGTYTPPTQAPGEAPQAVAGDAAASSELPTEGSGTVEGGGINIPNSPNSPNSPNILDNNTQFASPTEARPIIGQPLDKTWTAFHPDSGTLNIPRADMPQIKSEHRGAMTNFLNARGIESTPDVVPAESLKPTQVEFAKSKVEKASKFEGSDRAILVSSDGHVLDGHHQWLSKLSKNEPVKVIRLNAPIVDLLKAVREFPSAGMTKDAEPVTQPEQPVTGEGAGVSQPTQPAPTKKEQAKADLDHLFGVDDKRAKAIERIAKGTAYFSNPLKAGDFIAKSGLKDTHKVVKVSDKRWDIVAKGDPSKAEQPAVEPEPLAKETPIEVSYAENGKTLKIKDAKKAIADIDSKIQKFKDLIKCLRG